MSFLDDKKNTADFTPAEEDELKKIIDNIDDKYDDLVSDEEFSAENDRIIQEIIAKAEMEEKQAESNISIEDVSQPNITNETQLKVETPIEPKVEPKPQPEVKAEPKEESKAEHQSQPEVKAEPKEESKAEHQSQPEVKVETPVEPKPQPEVKAETPVETKTNTDQNAEQSDDTPKKKSALTEYKEIIVEFFTSHWRNKTQIWEMAKTDVIKSNRDAVLGWAWAFIKPTIRIFVYWFAIAIGLRATRTGGDVPYLAFLISGIIPWFYMNSAITGGTKVYRKYGYLVTKLRFPVMTIPTFVSLSEMIIHVVLLGLAIIVLSLQGFPPTLYILQLPLYMLMMFLFFNAWSLFAGMLGAMSKDFINLITSFTMALFWLSGILYNVDTLAEKSPILGKIMNWNPITIIAQGYRNSLVYHHWFWEKPMLIVHFLIVFMLMCMLMHWAYRKLRKDIADVL